jgi:hypothetical protein
MLPIRVLQAVKIATEQCADCYVEGLGWHQETNLTTAVSPACVASCRRCVRCKQSLRIVMRFSGGTPRALLFYSDGSDGSFVRPRSCNPQCGVFLKDVK